MMFSSRSPLALFSVLSTRCPQLHDYPLSVLFLENSLMTPTRTRNRRKTNLAASDTTVGSRPICAEPQAEELTMPHSEEVNWQPISEMPLIASLIDEALEDTRAHIKTLTEASARPHVMDDATVDRIDRVHTEQMEFVDIYAEQIGRWRTERPSVSQTRELDRMEEQNRKLRDATTTVLALSRDLRKGTIERVMEKSDSELGLEAVLRGQPATRR